MAKYGIDNGIPVSSSTTKYHMYDKKTGDYITTFKHLYEASMVLDIKWQSRHTIDRACRGQQKSAHGYLWSYCKWNNYYDRKDDN